MNQDLALKILSKIMDWDDSRASDEFRWLRLMARLKYDGYRDFQAGMRFIECLSTWLQQFALHERETAYQFVKERLVYVGPGQMRRLVEQFYPNIIQKSILEIVATEANISKYLALKNKSEHVAAGKLRRQTLIMGLSDGARIDILRHANVGRLSNEQLVLAPQVDTEKWKDLLVNLRADLGDPKARFRQIYLVDDFTATGTSFFRWNKQKGKWSGKLTRFLQSAQSAQSEMGDDNIFEDDWLIGVHHYLSSTFASEAIVERLVKAGDYLKENGYPRNVRVTFGTILPRDMPVDKLNFADKGFVELTNKYYDPVIQTKHTEVGGVTHMGLGYGGCALPVVLEHNTPNNSVALLWAETAGIGENSHAMRPLFRRRQRHT